MTILVFLNVPVPNIHSSRPFFYKKFIYISFVTFRLSEEENGQKRNVFVCMRVLIKLMQQKRINGIPIRYEYISKFDLKYRLQHIKS